MAKTAKQNRGKTLRRIKKGIAKASKRFVKNVKQLSARGRNILGRAKKMKIWGGWKPNAPTRTDTNQILNRYYAKYSKTSSKNVFEKLNEIPSDGKKRVLYVIDMQNDFIDEPSPELTGVGPIILRDGTNLGHIGAFAVNNGGNNLLNGINGEPGLIAFLDNNINNFEKIIFSRDLHDPKHCSFGTEGGTFPPHCVIGTYGSGFHPALNDWLSKKEDLFGTKIDIIFKGMHPHKDSFGAEAYSGDIGNKRQIGNKCCGSTMFDSQYAQLCGESIDTGSYKLSNNDIDTLGNNMGGTTWEEIKSNFIKYTAPKADVYYVCGLAGDFCVRDTALNLKDNHNDSSVYVLHDFTRNAFVPLSVPLMSSALSDNRYGEGLVVSHLESNTGKLAPIMAEEVEKGLHHYIFEFAPPSTYTILGKEEAEHVVKNRHNFKMDYANGLDANGKVIKPAELFGDGLQFFHFVSDHRQIIDDYVKEGITLFTRDDRLSGLQIDKF